MGYQFKLEALLKYRQFEEERLLKEFSDAMRLLEKAREILAEKIAGRSRCEEEFRMNAHDRANASQSAMYRWFQQRMADEIVAQQHQVRSALKNCEDVRQSLSVAIQKRKTLDKLKEKGEQAFLADLDSAERKFIDEMAISRFNLKG